MPSAAVLHEALGYSMVLFPSDNLTAKSQLSSTAQVFHAHMGLRLIHVGFAGVRLDWWFAGCELSLFPFDDHHAACVSLRKTKQTKHKLFNALSKPCRRSVIGRLIPLVHPIQPRLDRGPQHYLPSRIDPGGLIRAGGPAEQENP